MWCSPEFEGAKLGKYSIGSYQPPSSDPATIYRQLKAAIRSPDQHDPKIASQKSTISGLAIKLAADGQILESERDEIVAMLSKASITDWRPLIFVIPYERVASRVKIVPVADRASIEPEYIISDLADDEFRIIEPEAT